MLPNLPAHQGQRIAKGGLRLVIPGRLAHRQLAPPGVLVSQQGHQCEQGQQRGCGAQDGQVRPLPLGLNAQVFSDFTESHFNGLITNDKFCLSRTARLTLTWSRRPLRLRDQSTGEPVYPSDETSHCGGTDETPVENSPRVETGPGRATPMGSGLPIPSAMDTVERAGTNPRLHSDAGGVS